MAGLELHYAAVSHRGAVREVNEDSIGIDGWVLRAAEGTPLLGVIPLTATVEVVVADGLGGRRGGADASRIAVASFFAARTELKAAAMAADAAIRAAGADNPQLLGMASTLVGVRITPTGAASVFNVGDSRAYRIVDGYLGQVSTDDRPPVATEENRGVVTQALGGDRATTIEPHVFELLLNPETRLLLCSDGLSDALPPDNILGALVPDLRDSASGLLSAALAAGAHDNVSFVLVEVRASSE